MKQRFYHNRSASEGPSLQLDDAVRIFDFKSKTWKPAEIAGVRRQPRSNLVGTEGAGVLQRNKHYLRATGGPGPGE